MYLYGFGVVGRFTSVASIGSSFSKEQSECESVR